MEVYHYAKAWWVTSIANDGFLKLTGNEVNERNYPSQLLPMVWLTLSVVLPPTCHADPKRMVVYTFDSDHPDIHHWPEIRQKMVAGRKGFVAKAGAVAKHWGTKKGQKVNVISASLDIKSLEKIASENEEDTDE